VTHQGELLALILLVLLPTTGLGQVRVYGTIRDSLQGTPLALVDVLVEGTDLATSTDAQGRYALTIPLGFHILRFRRVSYHPVARELRLTALDPVRYDLTMLDQGQRLDPVDVMGAATPRTWPPGLDDRIRDGHGRFIADSMLRQYEHSTMSNLILSRGTGIRFTRIAGRNVAIARRGGTSATGPGADRNCYLAVWLDGVKIWEMGMFPWDPRNPRTGEPPPDFDRFAVVGLEAVEIYTAAQLPSQFRTGSAGCGAVVMWSRTSRPEQHPN